jgi:hypothetical protein
MESGCRDCVGPVPSSEAVAAAVQTAETRDSMVRVGEATLLPFGATDIRMGVLPATWL